MESVNVCNNLQFSQARLFHEVETGCNVVKKITVIRRQVYPMTTQIAIVEKWKSYKIVFVERYNEGNTTKGCS